MIKKAAMLFLIAITATQIYGQFFSSAPAPDVEVYLEIIPSELNGGDTFTVFATYEIPENYHMFLNEDLFNIYLEHPSVLPGETEYPMDESEELLGIPAFSGTVTIKRLFTISGSAAPENLSLEIQAAYQICEDDGTCLLPESKLFSRDIAIIGSGDGSDRSRGFEILWYIILAFAGGLLLNIMPCVLPLLSVKALNFVEQSGKDRKVILKSSLLYGAGIWVSFLAMAVAVIILKSSGEAFGWGFQFQNPLFVLVLLTLIFIFSLSLFDIYTFNPPAKGVRKSSQYSAGKSYWGSFLTGVFAVIVATPCTAPFMGAALGYAFSRPPMIILLIFTFLSIGFALPFVILGLRPSLIQRLPKPGQWMNHFKEFMGFLMLGTVLYMLSTLHSLIGQAVIGVLWFLLLTGLALWIFGRFGSAVEKKGKRIAAAAVAASVIILSALFLIDLETVSFSEKKEDKEWQVFSTELTERYRNEGKAVFIDFYADWCTSCKLNDTAVLERGKTLELFREYDVQLLKGDFTSGDREIARWLAEYDRAGVPLYILFRPGEDGHVFPEILSYGMIEKEVRKIKF